MRFSGAGSKWDPEGHFNGPKPLVPGQSLANYVVNSGKCDVTDYGTDTVPLYKLADRWYAVRTEGRVNDGGKVARTALEKIKLKVANSAATSLDNVIFLTGAWDDGDDRQRRGQHPP